MSQHSHWISEEDESLIDFVKINEVLYDIKHRDYRNAQLKHNLWSYIGNILNKTDTDCAKRWMYIRDYYVRQRSKPISGSPSEATKKRNDLLSFLDDFSAIKRRSITNIMGDGFYSDQPEEISVDVVLKEEDTEIDIPIEPTAPVKKVKMSAREEKTKPLERVVNRTELNAFPPLDELDHCFLSLAKIVKTLPKSEQIRLRTKFFTMAGEAELRFVAPSNSNSSC